MPSSVRLVAPLLACTCALASPAHARSVHADMSAIFNADVVVNGGGGMLDLTQDAIDLGEIASGNFAFTTQSVSDTEAGVGETPDGLVDDAFFLAGTFHPAIQLGWNESDDGSNAVRIAGSTGTVSADLPPDAYLEVHVLAAAGDGDAVLSIALEYADGTAPGVPATIPDWFDDPADTADRYRLVDGRDRMQPGSGPGVLFDYEDSNDPAIFGVRIVADPARTLRRVVIDRTDTTGVLSVFGVTAETVEVEACCFMDAGCDDLVASECRDAGGEPAGPGTRCASSPCEATEACCRPDGSCSDESPADCDLGGGVPQGAGTRCDGVTCPQPLPGWAPNGDERGGEHVEVARIGDAPVVVELRWGLGCSPDASDYTVHEGRIGDFTSHGGVVCNTGGALTRAELEPEAGDRYFLVVPITEDAEGSYGLDSLGSERPTSLTTPCRAGQRLGCP